MKKIFVLVIAFFVLMQVSYAQNDVFVKGDKVISASLGFINTVHTGTKWKTAFPPISLTGEYAIVDGLINGKASIGVGVDLGYAKFNYNANLSVYKYSNTIFGIRGGFHYQFIDNLDTYVSLVIGYRIVSGEEVYDVSEPLWGSYIGARYYFTDNFAAITEIGNAISLISIGVAYKF